MIFSIADELRSQFTNTIPTSDLLLSLLVTCVCALLVNFIYKKTYFNYS